MFTGRHLWLIAAATIVVILGYGAGIDAAERPNIVFILSDDVGIGDLSPYGQQTIQTPHLEQMAATGMQFSQMYSGAPVCSPSRAILMTGLHNGRHVNGNGINLQDGNETVAEVLQSAGYKTAGFGKWHLGGSGASLPTNQGFEDYYGILGGVAAWDHFAPVMQRLSSAAPNTVVNESNNGGFTDDLVGAEAAQFIRDNAHSGQPFYTQVNFQLAHFDMEVPELEPYTVNQPWPESRKIFASMITRLDRLVGDVIAAVDDPNGDGDTEDSIAENTLIVFASDNGTHIEPQNCCKGNHGPDLGVFSDDAHDPEFFDSNGQYRGWKRDLYDGGIKTPFIARWAGHIAPGSVNNNFFGDFADFLPTAAELAGTDAPVGIDGESYLHALVGTSSPTDFEKEFQYFEGGGSIGGIPIVPARRALIRNGLKAIEFTNGVIELYDLTSDPTESNNLFGTMSATAQEMIAIATEQDGGQISYRTHRTGDYFDQSTSWQEGNAPNANSIVHIDGNGRVASELFVDSDASVLGMDIGDSTAPIRLTVLPRQVVSATNGLRVREDSELRLEQASVVTHRRVELFGGKLSGAGAVRGTLVNRGIVAPDAMRSAPPSRPTPPNAAVQFDFTGVQDDAPLNNTSQLHPNLNLVAGFDFGPGTQPRSAGPDGFTGSDNGNEFNAGGFNTTSLSGAIAADDYLSYTVQAVPGFEMLVESASFDLWRNGGNAANDYAILSSLDGFVSGSEWAQLNNVTSAGLASLQSFVGTYAGGLLASDPVEIRLYGWNANDSLASTHITDVRLNATFVRTGTNDALDFNFAGVQDDSPLTQTLIQDPRLEVLQGFQYGPGTQPRSSDGTNGTDAGDEFNASGFQTNSLTEAISAGDFLTYTVQAVEGFDLSIDSVSYNLWRNGVNAAQDYAIMTSLDGFTAGAELSQLGNVTTSGAASEQTYTAFYTGGSVTADPVEIRLYGWNAGDNLASTHITAVSLDATFTLSGSGANFGETSGSEIGQINLEGNYLQLASGILSFDVGEQADLLAHDQLSVTGSATLDGLLEISLIDGYQPTSGDSFELLAAGNIEGEFAAASLPELAGGLYFDLIYNATSVVLAVSGIAGDYNYDGIVNAADYTVWRDQLGTSGLALPADGDGNGVVELADYGIWKTNFGSQVLSALGTQGNVPEPATMLLLCVLYFALSSQRSFVSR